jgi:predicted enzyme related to lactoylglutathione lyase
MIPPPGGSSVPRVAPNVTPSRSWVPRTHRPLIDTPDRAEEKVDEMARLHDIKATAILRAEDLARAREFYEQTLGLEIVDNAEGPTGMFSVRTGPDSGFSVYERPGMPAPQNTTLGMAVEDFDETVDYLREHGVALEDYEIPEIGLQTHDGVLEMDGAKTAWFRDSEGNIISVMSMPRG